MSASRVVRRIVRQMRTQAAQTAISSSSYPVLAFFWVVSDAPYGTEYVITSRSAIRSSVRHRMRSLSCPDCYSTGTSSILIPNSCPSSRWCQGLVRNLTRRVADRAAIGHLRLFKYCLDHHVIHHCVQFSPTLRLVSEVS